MRQSIGSETAFVWEYVILQQNTELIEGQKRCTTAADAEAP